MKAEEKKQRKMRCNMTEHSQLAWCEGMCVLWLTAIHYLTYNLMHTFKDLSKKHLHFTKSNLAILHYKNL